MPAPRSPFKIPALALLAALLGAALTAAPVGVDPDSHFLNGKIAFAKNGGGGNGNGGGNGGGNGNGNAGGIGNGLGNSANADRGLSKGTDDDSEPGGHGALASSLGALNAAHASPNALDNASPNSRVGRIATYGKVVEAEDTLADPNATEEEKAAAQAFLDDLGLGDLTAEEAERAALEDAANKTVTDKIMDAVNSLLDL
jgi:hypothetical protein